jgi:hypothetical protein
METETEEPKVCLAAVALIDALGFKEFAKRGPSEAARALERITAQFKSEDAESKRTTKEIEKTFGPQAGSEMLYFHFRAFCMSDTMALVVAAPMRSDNRTRTAILGLLVKFVGMGTARALVAASSPENGLAYRGAIACGEVALSDSFAVGVPIHEAAAVMEAADGAMVWLLPSALEMLTKSEQLALPKVDDANSALFVPHNIPFNDGRSFNSRAVNPFFACLSSQRPIDEIESALLATFSHSDLRVAMKRQRTEAFLREAKELTRRSHPHAP